MKVTIEKNEDGESYFLIPDEIQKELQWEESDVIQWIDNDDGSWTLRKLSPLEALKEKSLSDQEVKIEYEKIRHNINRLVNAGFDEKQATAIVFVMKEMKEAYQSK
ncbi:hypothetical protein [Vibrio mangrovi]|uniref:Uncharacterized protein n=1 Tax=Vibrio mangrovi TaxID=474394 RepID=A0A1Y6ISV2_9VIBR|nr:hypothetical protein [Vibrio mangrovi]MDW6004447.1 hypothetical protein [Vibrio mangrovi]MDW6004461.1 hypothetical protein [Vibrio mangrovi]SMS00749.1 hypothetical protein VIM7927_02018 [Vibrio mangrovi]